MLFRSDSQLSAIADQVNEALYLLDETTHDLSRYSTSLEADPAKLNHLQERRAELTSFVKRFGGSGDPDEEMIALAARAKGAKEAIADLRGGEERTAEIEKELQEIKKQLLNQAQLLTAARRKFAEKLGAEVTAEIVEIGRAHV